MKDIPRENLTLDKLREALVEGGYPEESIEHRLESVARLIPQLLESGIDATEDIYMMFWPDRPFSELFSCPGYNLVQ